MVWRGEPVGTAGTAHLQREHTTPSLWFSYDLAIVYCGFGEVRLVLLPRLAAPLLAPL
jgi:hypothetical protein